MTEYPTDESDESPEFTRLRVPRQFRFMPKEDITVYELAQIMITPGFLISLSPDQVSAMGDAIRHFEPAE